MKTNFLLTIYLISGVLMGQELFDPYKVHTLEIEFYNPDYDSILQAQWDVDDKGYELATIIFDGDTLDSVGVRYKGNSTFWWARETENPKFPLNLEFDLIHDNQDLLGYSKVKLSNSIFDATFVRETIGYLSESYYLPTSSTGYMNVTVNGELLGLYISVESINKTFLTKHFGNNTGAFFKCEPQFHYGEDYGYDAWPDLRWYGEDSTEYAYRKGYELKSETGWVDLLDLIYTLNFEIDRIETILNVDRVLWYFAVSNVMPDLDAYTGLYMHNYYLYRNTGSGQFEIIPWDKDHTFGGAQINTILELGGNVAWIYNWNPFLFEDDSKEERPLFSQLINVPLYKKLYTAHMRTIIEDIYSVEYFQDLAYGIQDVIETYAKNDPNLFPPFQLGDYFRYNVDNYLVTPDGSHWCGITSTVEKRLIYLLDHDEISEKAPTISNVMQGNMQPVGGEAVVITAKVEGADLVELLVTISGYRSRFISVPMLDDGVHGDGEANDKIYGATIPFQDGSSHVKYYIRADNGKALVLNPSKAEYEYYEYRVGIEMLPTNTVVINEINYNSADNFDPEDWVELYNPTDQTINITGWMFKDENDDHVYTIPANTALNPDQYVVLSKDTTAFNLFFPNVDNYTGNTGFGLSGGGELIRLFDSNGTLMDKVEYDDSNPWPEGADGNGSTLELMNPKLDNAIGTNWSASEGHGSPGRINTTFLVSKNEISLPTEFQVFDNYPNPFNPTTTISYGLPTDAAVNITIYDMMGRRVKIVFDGDQNAGFRSHWWDATNNDGKSVSAGIYLYTIRAGELIQTRKMVLIK